jgi:hypothetical protein
MGTYCVVVLAPKLSCNLQLYPNLLLFGVLVLVGKNPFTLCMCNKMQNNRLVNTMALIFSSLGPYIKSLHYFIALYEIKNINMSINCENPWEKTSFIHFCQQHLSWACKKYLEFMYTSKKKKIEPFNYNIAHGLKLPSIYCQNQISTFVIC